MSNDYNREPAKPVFAAEMNLITESEKVGDDQWAKTMFTLPFGEAANRVLLVGTLLETEDVGTDSEYWRGRVSDPTGSILIYAGEYQPEAAQLLAEIETPAFISVIGKPSTYEADNGLIISIRPESITVVDNETREMWVQEAARYALFRLKEMEDGDEKKEFSAMILEALRSI